MLVGRPAKEILKVQRDRIYRDKKRRTGTTPAEMARLLALYGYRMGRRITKEEPPVNGVCMLRIVKRGRGYFHWALLVDGVVYDPSPFNSKQQVSDYTNRTISFYEVERL
jgi:hypothetical protein